MNKDFKNIVYKIVYKLVYKMVDKREKIVYNNCKNTKRSRKWKKKKYNVY